MLPIVKVILNIRARFMYFHLNWIVFVSFLHAAGSSEALHLNLPFPARQIWLFVSSYVFEWQYVWLVSCCLKLRQKEWLGLFERSHGSCSFFAWVALQEASYLADDKCLCTLSCLRTPADFKPWQPASLSPPNLRPATSPCPSAQQINGSLSSLRPVAALATAA